MTPLTFSVVMRRLTLAALTSTVLLATARSAAAQQGRIAVRVTDAATQQPVSQAQVQIVGTTLGGLTGQDGRAVIRGVTPASHQVRVLRVGYAEQKKPVTVTANEEATVDFALAQVAVSLAPVVTTATGEQRRVEIGNSVAQIDARKVVEESPVRNVDDLLNSRTAGVAVQTGTQTGTGSRVRIRGQNSLNLANDPIYVIDGIRMTSDVGSNRYSTGGGNASRVGDINPEEIESVEVVKGPSAATLYGTDAANGVVVITTKKGRAGAPRWNFYGEGGYLEDRNTYPWNYTIAGHSPNATAYRECTLPQVSAGSCVFDSLRVYAPAHDPDATPIGNGNRYQAGVQVAAGSEAIRYFLAGEREEETGTLDLPDFERRRFKQQGIPLHDWTSRPNTLAKNSVRANINATLSPKLDVAVSSGFIKLQQRYTLESNATAGLGSHLFGGPGYKDNCMVAVTPATPCNGYRAWTPGYTWQEKTEQGVNRFILSGDANWRPFSWNQTRVTIGNDFTDRADVDLRYRGEAPPLNATYRLGFAGEGRTDIRNLTANLSSTGSFNPRPWLNSKTTAGVQYVNYSFRQNAGEGSNLPPGTQTPAAGAEPNAASATTLQKTLGFFAEEALGFNDRLFVTGAVRSDQNSAFGTNFQSVWYPKASVSWIISDESFFPQVSWLNSLRLRSAYGASGVQPGPNDAIRTFEAQATNVLATDQPGVRYNLLGNKGLKPEKSTEIEAGFETKLANNRVGLDVTFYHKRTSDALISAIVAPSAGVGGQNNEAGTTVRRNLGATMNEGWEFLGNAQLLSRRQFGWDVTLNASTNKNRLLDLGGTPKQINVETRVVEGYPMFGWWARPILGWQDKNKDGILTATGCGPYSKDDTPQCEVFVGDSAVFRGYTQPRYLMTFTNGIDLFQRKLRVQALLDYRGGYKAYNNTERIRCASRQNCNGLMNPNATFEEQAMAAAHLGHPAKTLDGFFQDGTFLKLREVTLRYAMSPRIASLLRARNADIIVTGRNLVKWTSYRGLDPENDYLVTSTTTRDVPSDFQTAGPASYYIVRLNLGF